MATDWHAKLDGLATEIFDGERNALESSKILHQRSPKLYQQIVRSGKCSPLLKLWGKCRNVDDNTGTQIVDSAVLEMLSELTHTPMVSPVVHAGIQHTYGYLFSLIETPYGKKRDRWVETYLEDSLGLLRPTFAPVVKEGTLLLNLTYFLGRIMYRGRRAEIDRLRRCQHLVDANLPQLDYRRLKCHRIEEELGTGKHRVRAVTALLPLPKSPNPDAIHALLIYGIESVHDKTLSLVTTFPISEQAFEQLLELPIGNRVEIQLKYNGYADGISRTPMTGRRQIALLES